MAEPIRCVHCGETRTDIREFGLDCTAIDDKSGERLWTKPRHKYQQALK